MRLTKVMDEIRTRFGKNSILRGISTQASQQQDIETHY